MKYKYSQGLKLSQISQQDKLCELCDYSGNTTVIVKEENFLFNGLWHVIKGYVVVSFDSNGDANNATSLESFESAYNYVKKINNEISI